MSDAIVVGSGPNGLACAVELAREGVGVTVLEAEETIGGGTRTSELTVPGLLHDHCSAAHPMAAGSPFLNSLDLAKHGLEWRWPEVDLAHPLDDGSAGVMVRSIEETAAGLGEDGARLAAACSAPSAHFEELIEDMLAPDPPPAEATRSASPASGSRRRRRRPCSPAPGRRRRRGRCSAASPRTPSARSPGR